MQTYFCHGALSIYISNTARFKIWFLFYVYPSNTSLVITKMRMAFFLTHALSMILLP